nr:kinesin 1 [Tanacetum cinerariifolium]
MNRGVSSDGGQSSLNYLFGGGEVPKPALKATQAAPCETPAANNVSAAKPDHVSPPIDVTKQILAGINSNVNKLKLTIDALRTRKIDFEPFVSDMDPDLVVKVLEYDLLAGVFGSEAYYEASLEDKSMLQFTIKDMENVIEDLKSKVTRAEGQPDSVEDKCIILSEANDDLKKELSFVKGRVRKRDEGHAEILSHGDKVSSDFSTDNKEALSSNSERWQLHLGSKKYRCKVSFRTRQPHREPREDSRDEAFEQREVAVKEVGILRGELQQVREDRERQLLLVQQLNSQLARFEENIGRTVVEVDKLSIKSFALEETCSSQRE